MASAYSDYRLHGLSLSDQRPVGILDLSYDTSSGAYAAASASVVATRHQGLKPLGVILNAGYAKRVSGSLTADIGVLHATYSHYSGLVSGDSYTEVYAGLAGKLVGARISLSPNYFGAARSTLRTEVNGHLNLSPNLRLEGEVGGLMPFGSGAYGSGAGAALDARVSLSRRLGRVSLHAAATARSGRGEIYYGRCRRRTAIVIGISTAL